MKQAFFFHRTIPSLLIAAMLTASLALTGCKASLHKMTSQDNDLYIDQATGITYQTLSSSYEPIARGQEYATLDLGSVAFTLHEISGLEPNVWLCSVYGDVYCSTSTQLAPFTDWDISALHVCTNTTVVISELTVRPDAKHTEEVCQAIFDTLQAAYRDGPAVPYPSYADSTRIYTLRFEAEQAPGLYYSLKMIEYQEDIYDCLPGGTEEINFGRTFLYDRYANRCVPVNDLLFRMLDGESAEDVIS